MDKQTAELRALVNNGQFEEALRSFDSLQASDQDGLRKLALDTIFDAVTKYRDNDDDNLRRLVVNLFDAIHPDLLKFRICFNFLTARSTPHLNELLTSQLRILVTPDFKENHPDEWLELKEVLPAKLAEHLSVESDDDVLYPAAHAAHIMFIFKEIPFLIPEGMSKVFAEAVNSGELELPAAFPLLVYHSRTHPFSPKLLQVTKPVVLIPSVYRRSFLGRRLVEGLIRYLQENEYNYERHFVKPIVSDLSRIVELLEDLDTADLDPCCNLLLPLLRFVEDFEQRSFRVPIMDKCQQLIQLFPSAQRCLFFKLILPKIFDNTPSKS